MEKLNAERKTARRLFTRSTNKLKEALAKRDIVEAAVLYEYLQEKYATLTAIDNKILASWINDPDRVEDEYEKDIDETEGYNMTWLRVKQEYEKVQSEDLASKETIKTIKQIETPHHLNLRLPKLEIPTFNGEVKNWLRFWGQFKKIHADPAMDDDDKFSFLLQAMEVGSSARQLVDTFPPCGNNYSKAVEQLKQRFARDEVIIEYYIRELLELIMRQVRGGHGKCSLRSLYDSLMTQIQGLESLGVTQDKYAAFLYPMVESALPEEVLKAYSRSRTQGDIDENLLTKLLMFLRVEVEAEERIALSRSGFNRCNINGNNEPEIPSASCFMISGQASQSRTPDVKIGNEPIVRNVCIWCDLISHASTECFKAQKMSLEERKDYLKNKRACFRCLKVGHNAYKCKARLKCIICSRRHVTLMCNTNESQKLGISTDVATTITSQHRNSAPSTVLLQTIEINIINNNKVTPVRALIDSGAQRSFISKDIIDKLNIKPTGTEVIQHSLFGGVVSKKETHRTFSVNLINKESTYGQPIDVLEQKYICNYLPRLKHGSIIAKKLQTRGIFLTDLTSSNKEIGMLIGSDVSGSLLTGRIVPIENNLVAIETKLGWTLQGPVPVESCNVVVTSTNCIKSFHCATFDITDMWKLEVMGIRDASEMKDDILQSEAWKFFENTIRMNEEGRYEVKLPWLETSVCLSSNYDIALKRLHSTTSRLTKLSIMKEYDEVFKEWLECGIIEKIYDADPQEGYYLPHHAVVNMSSLTTKIRPVFDASSSKKNELSLNDCLNRGANLIELIPPLIVKFRKEAIGITADIKKAFLQISLHPEERNFLKFLWWQYPSPEKNNIVTYRHKRVVFGVTTSPFLLAATIRHHLSKYNSRTAAILKESFYVDNLITSVNSKKDMDVFITEAKGIMLEGKFELRCWATGPELVNTNVQSIPVLGLVWDPKSDELYCKIPSVLPVSITKRSIMSLAHSIFDPIGYTCPVTILPKMLIQKCWQFKLGWDIELTDNLRKSALEWISHLDKLSQCRIPRRLCKLSLNLSTNSLHVFCDASAHAYGGCVFLRSELDGVVSVQLILAKCRVAPVKPTLTMPRLELLAALMSTRLAIQAKGSLGIESLKECYWTDSNIVLAWLTKSGLCIYVHNRVKEIREKTNLEDWYHVPGTMNPADLPSRGCYGDALLSSQWWNGPNWLYKSSEEWPKSYKEPNVVEANEEIVTENLAITCEDPISTKIIFSKFSKTIRVVAWCLRWLFKVRDKTSNRGDVLYMEEIERSEIKILKLIQKEYFVDNDRVKNLRLDIIRDDNGMLRVKTRLTLRDDVEDFKTPLLLPSKHGLVQRLVLDEHIRSLHAGPQILINLLRERYWIIGVRRLVKVIIRQCVICRRHSSKACTVPQAPLPLDRTKCGNVFDVTGVDFAGPLLLRSGEKCWVALFTCATYRAVHLELCTSLSTEDFLLALRRFVARRGNVSIIWSDNGTNFCGANRILQNIDWQQVSTKLAVQKIKWRFIPPRSPWWGGFWERLIRMLKDLLRRILGKATVNRTEMETLLCECESILNSRPLTYLAQDSDAIQALTPSMFLHNNAPPSIHHTNAVEHILNSRLKYIQKIKEDLRTRFRNEYLGLLVQEKGRLGTTNVKIGDVVLIQSEAKRIFWPLAVVMELIPGADGQERVARLKTAHRELVRPLQRLFPLEVHATELAQPMNCTRARRVVRLPNRLGI